MRRVHRGERTRRERWLQEFARAEDSPRWRRGTMRDGTEADTCLPNDRTVETRQRSLAWLSSAICRSRSTLQNTCQSTDAMVGGIYVTIYIDLSVIQHHRYYTKSMPFILGQLVTDGSFNYNDWCGNVLFLRALVVTIGHTSLQAERSGYTRQSTLTSTMKTDGR